MKYTLICVLALSFFLAGCSYGTTTTPDVMELEVESSIPEEVVNEQGEIDEEKFAEHQEVSDSDELDVLEAELEETIILEEDFSDLE